MDFTGPCCLVNINANNEANYTISFCDCTAAELALGKCTLHMLICSGTRIIRASAQWRQNED